MYTCLTEVLIKQRETKQNNKLHWQVLGILLSLNVGTLLEMNEALSLLDH